MEPVTNTVAVQKKREERDISLREFIGKYLRYWYLFVISIILCIGTARYYNWYQNPVFAVSAKLQVRDDKQGPEGLFKALDMDVGSKNIENEIEVIRSFNILAKTLNDLEFDISYFLVGDVKVSEVYKDCPFKVVSEQLSFEAYSIPFYFYIEDAEHFNLSFEHGEEKSFKARFGDTLRTSLGQFTVLKRDNFPEEALQKDAYYAKRKYRVRFNTMGYNQNRYLSRLSVALARPQSTILQVYLEDEVPQKALDFVNKLVEVYLDNDVDQKNKAAAATRVFLDEQLESITEDLESIEINRERYKVAKGIIDLESESQLVLESIRELDQQRALNSARVSMIDQLESYVADNADLRDLAPAALDITDPLLIRLINKLSELQGQRQQIINRSTANDPTLVPLNAEIELTRSSLLENIRNIRKGLLRKESEVKEDINALRNRMSRIPTTERELLEIERRFRIQEGLYTFLLQKRAELSISLAAAESNTRLVDAARLLPGPIRPIPEKAYSVALLIGLLLPMLIIFLIERLNDTVNDLKLLKSLTSVPLLGMVRLSNQERPLVVVEKPQSPIAEEYRAIRANLSFYLSEKKSDVILVTSSVSTEGKTFTAMNLACVLAASGAKVILLGLDMRKPRIIEDFDLSNEVGCSNYLSGMNEVDEVIQASGILDSLYVITAGPVPPNPSELILSKRMELLIETLKDRFDHIVIDSPPVGMVADAMVMSKYADITMFIVRYAVTTKEHVKYMDEMRSKGQLGKVTMVYNAVSPKGSAYGSGYGYGYGGDAAYGAYFDVDEDDDTWKRWLKPGRKK